MNGYEIKNSLAKLIIIAWIMGLLLAAGQVAFHSVTFDVNTFFGLNGNRTLPENVVREIKAILLMLSVAIVGGVSFMIKDFYRSVKYANLYSLAYGDYRAGHISRAEFQRLVTVDVYMGRFNHTWVYWFFIQPVLSSALGVIAFFIARSGLGVLQGSSAVGGDLTIQSIYMYAVFTFLAGFSSHKFIAWLDRLADKIFSTTLPEQKEADRAKVATVAAMDREVLRDELDTDQPDQAQVTQPVQPSLAPAPVTELKPVVDQTGFAGVPMKSII